VSDFIRHGSPLFGRTNLAMFSAAVGLIFSVYLVGTLSSTGIVVVTFGFFGGHSIVSTWVGRRAGAAKANATALHLFAYYAPAREPLRPSRLIPSV
jgi:hypothetical protein